MNNSCQTLRTVGLIILAGSSSVASEKESIKTQVGTLLESTPLPYIPTRVTIIRHIDGKIFIEERNDDFGLDPRVSRTLYAEFDKELRKRWDRDPRTGVPNCGDVVSTEDIIKYILYIFTNSGGILDTTAIHAIENGTVTLQVEKDHFSSYIYPYLEAKYPHIDTPSLVNFLTVIGPISLCEDTFTDSTGKKYTFRSTLDNVEYIRWFEEVFQKMRDIYICIKDGGIFGEEFSCHWYSLQEKINSGLEEFYTSTQKNPTNF